MSDTPRPPSPAHAALLATIDDRAAATEATLRLWAEINTGSANTAGLLRLASELAHELRALGAVTRLVPLAEAAAPAVHASIRPEAPLRVLLSGHFDTVYEEAHRFQTCDRPAPDVLRGPGVADMKGGLLVMLEALRALESSPDASGIGWDVLLTPDEETGSSASTPLLHELAPRAHLGLVFEPALPDGSIVAARMGVGTVRAVAKGRAAHAGRDFAHGRNAVVALAHLVSSAHFLNHAMQDVVVNAGSIRGGGAVNIVPDHAEAEFNLRARRPADGDELLRRLRDAAGAVARAEEVEFEITGGFSRPPLDPGRVSTEWIHAWLAGAAALGANIAAGHSGGGSDANILAAAGLPCIDGIGVEGGDLHSSREWMRPSSLPRRAKITALFLLRLASGEIVPPRP
jgi:glutamate carboxypeptidase